MDTNGIRGLATGVRDALRAEVSARLDAALAEGSRERLEDPRRVAALEADLSAHGREEVVDRAAYTWFNRLCALRYMDARGHTPVGLVTPRPGTTMPAVLADASRGLFDPALEVPADVRARVSALLLGQEASDGAAEEAYALLLRAACERYARPMPYLFSEGVASPLLMPRGLLAQGSLLSRVVEGLDEGACSSVEVLGWLYQFYVAERKDEVFAKYRRRGKAEAADIPAATQLFTPDWIVRYLVENSLGRLWVLSNPGSDLAVSMDYFVAPEGSEPHVGVASASDIRVLDPACGSGHILTYAFDLLFRMYEEEGWPEEDIPAMILGNNLSGLEIDRRAAEIASFALEMKALERDPSFLEREVDADVLVLEPVSLDPQELELVPQLAGRRALLEAMAHLDEVGSLYVPEGLDEFVLQNELERVGHDGSLFAGSVAAKLGVMLANVKALSRSFHCVVANPPYMGSGNMNQWLSGWVKRHYPDEKSDLCTCFISRGLLFAEDGAYAAMITASSWMFISSFESLRRKLVNGATILSMIQQSTHGYPNVTVPTTMFVLSSRAFRVRGTYIRLEDFDRPQWQQPRALEAIMDPGCGWLYRADAEDFKAIPGWPIAYWASDAVRNAFSNSKSISDFARPRQGLATGDNKRFIRGWWEASINNIGFGIESREQAAKTRKRWFPCNKGGAFRKWYGNNWLVVNWENDGYELRHFSSPSGKLLSRPQNIDYYFHKGITWGAISSSDLSMRYSFAGAISETKGAMCFADDDDTLFFLLALTNSSLSKSFFSVLSPTLDYHEGPMGKFPVIRGEEDNVIRLAKENVELAKQDWDTLETSWGFIRHPLTYIPNGVPERLTKCYERWESECSARFEQLKSNEEELNRIFARIYNMEGEVPIEVPDDKVSVRLADRARDARSLVSYAVGCLLGRYSTEAGGLVLADQGATLGDFAAKVPGAAFLPDGDNVLPVIADEWFEDDVVAGVRCWLAHAYGAGTLDENVAWLEESLGKTLRAYLCRDFYADHVRVYQKRPIYWMFQSPKKTFQCLVYMHRYDAGTVGTVLTGYLRPLEEKLRARLRELEAPGATAAEVRQATRVRAQVDELERWEREVVYPLAQERVEIDLDDGVKVNYNRFPRALAKVAGLSEWR